MQDGLQIRTTVRPETLQALRETIARIERNGRRGDERNGRQGDRRNGRQGAAGDAHEDATPSPARGLSFGIDAIDRHLPGGALQPGLHEIAGRGRDLAPATAPALLAASLIASGPDAHAPVLWVVERRDLFAPGLACTGLAAGRLVMVEARGEILGVMEEAARTPGLAGVVGEIAGPLTLTASRRLQLAAEEASMLVFAIRRPRIAAPPGTVSTIDTPNAAATRWRIACLPSRPLDPIAAGPFSLTVGRALWRLELVRARNAAPGSWIVEAFDEKGRLALPAASVDRPHCSPPQLASQSGAPFQQGIWQAGDLVA